jgi:hypothetical protein
VTRSVALRGSGRVELAAYGVADAEHRVEKELGGLWPGARVEVLEVARTGGPGRIVEEFAVRYRLRGVEPLTDHPDAAAVALRALRERFSGSRFERIDLEIDAARDGTTEGVKRP